MIAACSSDARVERDATELDATDLDVFTEQERAMLGMMSPLYSLGVQPSNAFANDELAARLGQMLFFDRSYAGPLLVGDDGTNGGLGPTGATGRVACQSCHGVDGGAFDDNRTRPNHISLGTGYGSRNAIGLVNSSYYQWEHNWGGGFDSQWSVALVASEDRVMMNSTRLQIVHLIYDKYRTEYEDVFPFGLDPGLAPTAPDAARFPASGRSKAAATDPDGPWELMTDADRAIAMTIWVNYSKALEAYVRTLVSRDAPFDRYVAGDTTAISDAAKRGLHTFLHTCAGCHGGPLLADGVFHALGLPQTGAGVPPTDLGRYQDVPTLLASPYNFNGIYSAAHFANPLDGLVQSADQRGTFRTPTLRNVALSAPYMHAGQLATLADVVAFYNAGGGDAPDGVTKDPQLQPLGLSTEAQADLVALLETFTGAPVPAQRLVDISK